MSSIELILKDIQDPYIRENFFRLSNFINGQIFFDGDFELFDVTSPTANPNFEVRHGLNFIPNDVILLAVEGDHNFYFQHQAATKTSVFIFTSGPCRIRFLLGRFSDKVNKVVDNQFTLVSPLTSPRLIQRFNTDVGTLAKDLVRVSGVNTVTKVTANTTAQIPNGIFGVGFYKPSTTLIDVLFSGIMAGYAGFTAGFPLFVSTTGVPTHTAPTGPGMVQQIGFATSTTEFFVHLLQPMRRGP